QHQGAQDRDGLSVRAGLPPANQHQTRSAEEGAESGDAACRDALYGPSRERGGDEAADKRGAENAARCYRRQRGEAYEIVGAQQKNREARQINEYAGDIEAGESTALEQFEVDDRFGDPVFPVEKTKKTGDGRRQQ